MLALLRRITKSQRKFVPIYHNGEKITSDRPQQYSFPSHNRKFPWKYKLSFILTWLFVTIDMRINETISCSTTYAWTGEWSSSSCLSLVEYIPNMVVISLSKMPINLPVRLQENLQVLLLIHIHLLWMELSLALFIFYCYYYYLQKKRKADS